MIGGSNSCGYEVFYILGYITVPSVESQSTFRRNTSPPSCCLLHAGFLLDFLINPKDGGDMPLRNIS
jgi:hypothetical protein